MSGNAVHTEQELFDADYYVPAFEIYVGGKTIGKGEKLKWEVMRDVVNVTYTDNLESIDSFSFTVNNWDAEKRAFKYLNFDDNPFNVGKEIEVRMGYAGNLKSILQGEITSLAPDFPQSGNPTLTVGGLNILYKLRKKQETHFYKNKSDGQIARQIAGRLGLQVGEIETGDTHTFIAQKNRFDIVFLLERARRIGYEVTVTDDGKLHFKPSTNTTRKTYVLEWGKTLINFRPTLTTAKQVKEVVVKGWSPQKKKTITGKAERKDLKTKGLGSKKINEVVEKAFNERVEVIVDRPISDEQEAKKLAQEKLEQIAKDMVKAEGSTIGLPELRAGSLIEIKGLGDTFNGNYYVTGSTHSIGDSGYITKFNVRREETKEKS